MSRPAFWINATLPDTYVVSGETKPCLRNICVGVFADTLQRAVFVFECEYPLASITAVNKRGDVDIIACDNLGDKS